MSPSGDSLAVSLRSLAERLTRDAAAIVRREAGHHPGLNKSSETDWVTEVDETIESRLVAQILAERHHDGIVGEEGSDIPGTSAVRWLIDPIDGTTNFMHDHPGYSVSVAAELDGSVVAGAVCDARLDELFSAHAGGGATRDGAIIRVRDQPDFGSALIATGFSYKRDRRRRQIALAGDILDRAGDLRRVGSAAIDLCSVACGRVAGFYEHGLHPWDYAAGALIAAEAGAVVLGPDGGPPSPNLVLAATPGIAQQLAALVSAHEV